VVADMGQGRVAVIDFGKGKNAKITGYTFKTSDDPPLNDPVKSQLEGYNDESLKKWNIVHSAEFQLPEAHGADAGVIWSVMKGGRAQGGGLFNDYAQQAHHECAKLLLAFVMVVLGGGLNISPPLLSSLSWLLGVLFLIIVSWLYTPCIFNPYQFFYQDWWDFAQARDFFFKDGSRQWYEWYIERQLKPMSGIRSSPTDLVIWLVFVFSWYTVINVKMHLATVVFSGFGPSLRSGGPAACSPGGWGIPTAAGPRPRESLPRCCTSTGGWRRRTCGTKEVRR